MFSTWFPPFVFALFLETMSDRILVKAFFSFGASISWERGFNCHSTVPRRQWHERVFFVLVHKHSIR